MRSESSKIDCDVSNFRDLHIRCLINSTFEVLDLLENRLLAFFVMFPMSDQILVRFLVSKDLTKL